MLVGINITILLKIFTYALIAFLLYLNTEYIRKSLFNNKNNNSKAKEFYVILKEGVENSPSIKKQDELDQLKLKQAGINLPIKKIKVFRNIFILIWLIYLHVGYFSGKIPTYPLSSIITFLSLFMVLSLNSYSPLSAIVSLMSKSHKRKVNMEIFNLYQMFLNEFEQADSLSEENNKNIHIEFLMKDFRKHTKRVTRAINVFLENVDRYPRNLAYDLFAEEVDTDDARRLASILFEISKTSSLDGKKIMEMRYSDFKKRRQENHRLKMKNKTLIGYAVGFTGSLTVLISAFSAYYLEFVEMSNNLFQYGDF